MTFFMTFGEWWKTRAYAKHVRPVAEDAWNAALCAALSVNSQTADEAADKLDELRTDLKPAEGARQPVQTVGGECKT